MARYRSIDEGLDQVIVGPHGEVLYTMAGSAEHARAEVARLEEQARAALEALDSGDPLRLCELGWHRVEPGGLFFRQAGGQVGRMLVFRVGPLPLPEAVTVIKAIGPNAQPWTCAVCGAEVGTQAPTG